MKTNLFLHIEQAAHTAALGQNRTPSPTPAQCLAGNYKVGRARVFGLPISIENPRGSYRSGTDKSGKEWRTLMPAHYGYINGTKGNDGDCVDCFIGPLPDSEKVFVINQAIDGQFDEHKVMLCFDSEAMAQTAYLNSYERGWKGLSSMAAMSVEQFKWWLENGDMSQPILTENLPKGVAMKKVYWDRSGLPADSLSLDKVLYEIRRDDDADALLLDSVSVHEILEDSDGILVFDALVTPYATLERKMEVLRGVMDRASANLNALAVQISTPFKQRGVTNVAAIFELSDGQTISVFFHNPDVNPNNLGSNDELISWKWLLNKKDITIVVAPEKGVDLNLKEVSLRIMKLAEKNSAMFKRANAKRSERMQNIQNLKDEISGLEKELSRAQSRLEAARIEAEDRKKAEENQEAITVNGNVYTEINFGEDKAKSALNAAIEKHEGNLFDAAKDVYQNTFKGRFVKTKIGNVLMTGFGWKEIKDGLKKDFVRAKTVPFIPYVLGNAESIFAEDLYKERSDGILRFHRFSKLVDIDESLSVKVELKVGERADHQLVYYIRTNEILDSANDKPQVAWCETPRILRVYPGNTNATLDSTLDQETQEINLIILEVYDRNTGERLYEYEDSEPTSASETTSPIVELTGKELGDFPETEEGKKALRETAKAQMNTMLGTWIPCPALDGDVEIRKSGIKKFISTSADTRKLRLVSALDQIIRNGKKLASRLPYNNDSDKSARAYHVLRTEVSISGQTVAVRTVIKEDANGKFHYDATIHAPDIIFDSAQNKGRDESQPLNMTTTNGGGTCPSCFARHQLGTSISNEMGCDNAAVVFDSTVSNNHKNQSITSIEKGIANSEGIARPMVLNLFIEGEEPEEVSDDGEAQTISNVPLLWSWLQGRR